MKNKKVITLLIVIVIAIIIGAIYYLNIYKQDNWNATGSSNDFGCGFGDNYMLFGYSNELGHPGHPYNFVTYYIEDSIYRNTYKFKFEVMLGIKTQNKSVYEEFENYDVMPVIKLFDKNFKYKKISDEEIILTYKFDNSHYITINLEDLSECYNLEGNCILDENGNEAMLEKYDFLEKIKENKKFSSTLSSLRINNTDY